VLLVWGLSSRFGLDAWLIGIVRARAGLAVPGLGLALACLGGTTRLPGAGDSAGTVGRRTASTLLRAVGLVPLLLGLALLLIGRVATVSPDVLSGLLPDLPDDPHLTRGGCGPSAALSVVPSWA